jgi:ATP-dependent Clp protease ATP-binding subunit ClpX
MPRDWREDQTCEPATASGSNPEPSAATGEGPSHLTESRTDIVNGDADTLNLTSAPKILKELRSVIGQRVGKRDLATLLAMHVHWSLSDEPDPSQTAPNALIIGPTGVGKTHTIRTAAQVLQIPLAMADATRMLAPGVNEESLDAVLLELLRSAREVIHRRAGARDLHHIPELEELRLASRGIVFLDEFDKLATSGGPTNDRAEQVQRRLLQFIDGARVTLSSSRYVGEEEAVFDTSGLLFVVAGAFSELPAIISHRPNKVMRGLMRHDHVIPQDLIEYGFMKELIARIPVIIEFTELSEDDLVKILNDEKIDPSQFYVRYLASLGVHLEITDDARRWIAKNAADLDVGARGLHQVLFPILSLLSQEVEDDPERPDAIVLNEAKARELDQSVKEKRNARTSRRT